EAHKKSLQAAELINQALVNATNGEDRGVKQAPFIVLMGATMPAVLI
ncbi:MAG: N-acetylmuramoyl-L-alanine amidase, partial [Phycisphaerae bacterium]|nr:N-acetylmuramoyl-L-alanine amidase [Phycisphaerae bacterium]NIX00131.1 N-acetylmuramoyl-L-alanine amidase [Phycisphaerae bacterium]NIX27801.1 N-acetylmuramoyl-L-alanine amidase [Phycisphaerae bacterium]